MFVNTFKQKFLIKYSVEIIILIPYFINEMKRIT